MDIDLSFAVHCGPSGVTMKRSLTNHWLAGIGIFAQRNLEVGPLLDTIMCHQCMRTSLAVDTRLRHMVRISWQSRGRHSEMSA